MMALVRRAMAEISIQRRFDLIPPGKDGGSELL